MTMPRRSAEQPTENEYPWVHWRDLRMRIDQMWDPENTPHHSVIGLTGSGKTYLVRHGLLDLCRHDRVLCIDTKGTDPILRTMGKVVKRFPRRSWYHGLSHRQDEPEKDWYRLVVPDNVNQASDVVGEALNSAYAEGDWIIYIDELWDVTSNRKGVGLGLEPEVTRIYRKGRGKRVSLVAATQTPAWVPGVFYDQASFAWVGRIRDESRQKRLIEVGGLAKRDLPIISTLKPRQWLMCANTGEEIFVRTVVQKRGVR